MTYQCIKLSETFWTGWWQQTSCSPAKVYGRLASRPLWVCGSQLWGTNTDVNIVVHTRIPPVAHNEERKARFDFDSRSARASRSNFRGVVVAMFKPLVNGWIASHLVELLEAQYSEVLEFLREAVIRHDSRSDVQIGWARSMEHGVAAVMWSYLFLSFHLATICGFRSWDHHKQSSDLLLTGPRILNEDK